ncbi:hypothetical protein ARMSODRAFT_1005918 [Armillaria solidipes]|uniref:Uncharacterized protein n=1 Tax=Armillaria solidipes TaxID=1076256 RepID=A0A2H3BUV1_9AGAR|nr:hypothetical protein ARMSODRAFT_1005918 [Armillaria solidipes]
MSEEQVSLAMVNQELLGVFVHGIHTSIVVFTLWAIFSSKERRPKTRNIMVFLIVLLYIFATICVATNWAFATMYLFTGKGSSNTIVRYLHRWPGTVALGMNSSIADWITIWRCWIIWGRRWYDVEPAFPYSVINLPSQPLRDTAIFGRSPSEVDWTVVYLCCSLGTTLLCTTLITYRIVTAKKGTNDCTNTNTYHRVIEVLIESALLYAIGLIGFIVLITLNLSTSFFAQTLFVSITAISPTLIAARVASGNARPNDSWQASNNASSLRFGSAAHSTSVNADSELTANRQDADLEQGGSEATDNRELEHVVNTGQVPENRGKEAASNF